MKFISIFLIFILLYGCKNDGELDSENHQVITLKSVSTTNDTFSPLAVGTEVGIYGSILANGVFHAQNLRYIAAEEILNPYSTPLELPNQAESTTIYAYTPYSATKVNNSTLAISVNTDQNSNGTSSSDVMWSQTIVKKSIGINTLEMERKMSLLRINISSASGAELSSAKVEVLNLLCEASLDLIDGSMQLTSNAKSNIQAKKISDEHYEAIILPQSISSETDFIRITLNQQSYIFKLQPKTFDASKAYTYDIKIQDKAPSPLEYTLIVLYGNTQLGTTLSIPAKGEEKGLDLNSIPSPPPYYHRFKIRNKSGEPCWAKISHISSGDPDAYGIADAWGKLRFNENIGPKRSMTLEFYDMDKPQDVYKSIVVTQQASESYLTLSTQSINADRFGSAYDISYEIGVESNLEWTIEKSESWISVKYVPATKNQTIFVDLAINQTGVPRSGSLRFKSGANIIRTLQVTQTATESATFTLRYEFNLELTTYGNWFQFQTNAYPDIIEIFNHYPSEFGDETAKLYSNAPYGFVVDAPSSFNKIIANGLRHDKFLTYRNYSGRAGTIKASNISVIYNRSRYAFFRSFYLDMPIPSGIKRNQMVSFTFKVTDTTHMLTYPNAEVETKIIELQPK